MLSACYSTVLPIKEAFGMLLDWCRGIMVAERNPAA
jgi:hypothetical protein